MYSDPHNSSESGYMSFDEHLTHAFDTLSERLRSEIDQEVQRRTAEAIAAAPPAPSPPPDPPAPPDAAGGPGATPRLAATFEAIDRARSLTDVLDTLLTAAREDAPDADLWLIRGGRLQRWRSTAADDAGDLSTGGESADASSTADDTPPRLEDGIPLTIAGQTVAVLFANSELGTQNAELGTPDNEPRTSNDERRTSNVAILARYASRCLESLTAFKTARALTEHAAPRHPGTAAKAGDEGAEEDTAARRYARLLVSEIKLYHEPAVIEGRRDRDLATRLGGEIARARVMYEQRVPAHVRERADYFRDELVTTLANGDARLLEVRS
jgi:hypothetical protein